MRKTKVEILNETAAYYNNSNRSTNPDFDKSKEDDPDYKVPSCLYNGPEGKHCAFARCCTDPSSLAIWESKGVFVITVDDHLKNEYHGHNNDFWFSVQQFHDDDKCWDEQGLTTYGVGRLQSLIAEYGYDENNDECPF